MEYSAGLICYRNRTPYEREFFVVHPGGVFYRTLEKGGYWVFPKGNVETTDWYALPYSVTGKDEVDAALHAALREFREETGDKTDFRPLYNMIDYLGKIKQRKGKTIYAFAIECTWNLDPKKCYSNIIDVEYAGQIIQIPENDGFQWMTYGELEELTHPAHLVFYQKIYRIR